MRDAQSILDQMISFCGAEIGEPDVLDVYGLVSAEKVAELGAALAAGDHKKIIAIVDECDAGGRDLVRLLADLQALVRTALIDAIAQGNVRFGLAEKVNFEVTLLKAVEASRARAIDSLIRELASIADETAEAGAGEKKKG
jgi:DNA polymerase-3 subunit gamma/tau